MKRTLLVAAACVAALTSSHAETIVGITAGNHLITFDTESPESLTTNLPITGLPGGDFLLGIDFRPADGNLYALGNSGNLYRLNVASGAATLVVHLSADPADSTSGFTGLSGTSFGIDFNPAVDRLRVVSNTEQNLRVNPDTGAVITDTNLNPGDPSVSAAAYTNNFVGATTTTLYVIDSASNSLMIQNPPNAGTLSVVGSLGGDAPDVVGFDISGTSGSAYAAAAFAGTSSLFSVDLATGTATSLGQIGSGSDAVTDISVAQPTHLLNISTRARVGTGEDVLIAGFIAGGSAPMRVIARAIGPSLSGAGISEPLADPVLQVFDGNGNLIGSNDNWRSSQETEISATGLAPSNDAEAAIIGYLAPGSYTVEVSGKNNTTGVALVEIYQL